MTATHVDRWPFDPNTPHTNTYPCMCADCRHRRAAGAKAMARWWRLENARHMVDPDYVRDRKR